MHVEYKTEKLSVQEFNNDRTVFAEENFGLQTLNFLDGKRDRIFNMKNDFLIEL